MQIKSILLTKVFLLVLVLKLFCSDKTLGQSSRTEFSDSENLIALFYDALRNKNIDQAHQIAATSKEWDSQNLASNLIEAYIGEALNIQYDTINLNEHQKLLYHLNMGYKVLKKPDTSKLAAYQNFSEAIRLADNLNFKPGLKFALLSMLDLLSKEIFLGSDKFTPYLDHYKEVKTDVTDELIISLYEVALNSKENKDFEALAAENEIIALSDELFSKVSDEHPLKLGYYYNKAIQSKINDDYEGALGYMRRLAFLAKKNAIGKESYKTSTWQLSSIFNHLKKTDSALFYLNESRALEKDLRDKFYNERLASWIYNELGKFDSAYFFLEKSIQSEWKLDAKNSSLESALLSVENETEKLKLDKLRLDNRRKTNQNYFIAALSLLIIGAITAIFLQKNTTKKRKLAEQEALLEQQKVETLLKEQELVSIDAMIAGQEKERTKVANELHDDLGSLMATIKLHFDNLKVDKKDLALKSAQDLLEKAYQKIRGMAHAKNSGVMANQGLLPAVQRMAKTINETNALKVTVEDFGLEDRMENSLELTVFRILQELVANIIKHAEATKANIQFTQHEDKLNIIVEDNGKGFDMSNIARSSNGMGLGTIEKRIEHLEGSFTVDSILGKGTSILIDIPI